jgi:SpoVK/Ycf46/Vps4 family AAA+-type ATPase
LSSGDLATNAKEVEIQLSCAFRLASCWNAILLLDEADVFMKQRSLDHVGNNLTLIFLRKLKYYEGIIILTTNRVKDFDDAMRSRIRIAIKYPPLGTDTRRGLWASFLTKAVTSGARFSYKELEELARRELNGRQVGILKSWQRIFVLNYSYFADQKCCRSSPCLSARGKKIVVLSVSGNSSATG